jgi:hypothetical protein
MEGVEGISLLMLGVRYAEIFKYLFSIVCFIYFCGCFGCCLSLLLREICSWGMGLKTCCFEYECRWMYNRVLRQVAALSAMEMAVMWLNCED